MECVGAIQHLDSLVVSVVVEDVALHVELNLYR